jgi:hypothetical protein
MSIPPPITPFLPDCLPPLVRHLQGVLTDIDDTLTCDGAIAPEALAALEQLQAAQIPVIAITGRPVGWSEPFARSWPLRAIVAENGSVCLYKEREQLQKIYLQDADTRQRNYQHLQQVLMQIEAQIPGACRAQDSAGRETDIAIDHSEHRHLDEARIAEVVLHMRTAGLSATVSSIHINGWIGSHHKWQGACCAVRALLGQDLAQTAAQWVYVGDSTNDQVMFEHLPWTVGVANIRRFWSQLQHHPRWVTAAERGVGFAQVARAVLALQKPANPR